MHSGHSLNHAPPWQVLVRRLAAGATGTLLLLILIGSHASTARADGLCDQNGGNVRCLCIDACAVDTQRDVYDPANEAVTNASSDTYDAGSSAVVDPTDPATPAPPTTPIDDQLGALGLEDSPAGASAAEEGAPDPGTDSLAIYVGPTNLVSAVEAGRLSLTAASAAADASRSPFEVCGLSFRRRIDKARAFSYQVTWGARFSCNRIMDYMNFRARLVFVHQDNSPISYGNQISKDYVSNEFSGGAVNFTFDPHLVVYVSGTLTFPTPYDPNNYAVGVAADPSSANQGKSTCKREGKTFRVHCEARSFAFGKA